jgi:predicted Rossmann fold flavoprotein
MVKTDVIVIGAGGAGMMCALQAGRRGRQVLLLDHARRLGGKILISGGGRCNFTNTGASPAQYVSRNPHFCKSALSRYPAESFIAMVKEHGIAFHEKKLGQLFCDDSAKQIVNLLRAECDRAGARFELGCEVREISRLPEGDSARFSVETSSGTYTCESLVVATGGLSLPKTGATALGYTIAQQFGLNIVETAPALDGFNFADTEVNALTELAGISIDCVIECNGVSFRENILFTHAGLSGPAALQASLHWHRGDELRINLLPEIDALDWLISQKHAGNKMMIKNILSERLPSRFAELFCRLHLNEQLPINQMPDKVIEELAKKIHNWALIPSGTVGYSKAEVTRGGVDTDELSSKTMESKKVPGLYFIGEVIDVTGWLGGYNFQWAWASGWAAGQAV